MKTNESSFQLAVPSRCTGFTLRVGVSFLFSSMITHIEGIEIDQLKHWAKENIDGDIDRDSLNLLAKATGPLIAELEKAIAQIDVLLQHCPNAECMECSKIICPHGHEFHFHHDGCPACAEDDDKTEDFHQAEQID